MRVDRRELAWDFHQLSCSSWSNENKSCMRVDIKREFAWEFHKLSCSGQTRTRVAWELTSESLHESFINSRVLVKREQELHESWQARVCMRVSSTLVSWSNENKSCMRVDKREFTWEFHQLSCPGQMRTRVEWLHVWSMLSKLYPHRAIQWAWNHRISSCKQLLHSRDMVPATRTGQKWLRTAVQCMLSVRGRHGPMQR